MGRRKNIASQYGVTLIELLVALAIFAFLSSAVAYALRLSIEGREQLMEVDAALKQWQIASIVMKEDLAQLAPRTVRDEFGNKQTGPFLGGRTFDQGRLSRDKAETYLLGFVKRGWTNLDGNEPRSELQYVEYVFSADVLVRRTRPYLDAATGHDSIDRILLKDLESVSIEFLSGQSSRGLEWADSWPLPGRTDFAPQAIKISFDAERIGQFDQLFWLGTLERPDD